MQNSIDVSLILNNQTGMLLWIKLENQIVTNAVKMYTGVLTTNNQQTKVFS